MKKIIAIGGGEIGRPGHPIETLKIDREIVRLSGKKHPRLLFIGTASEDSESYFEVIQKYFGKRLGCRMDILRLVKEKPPLRAIEKKIMGVDIIYVGGGNTMNMLRVWKRTGTDKILKKAWQRGIVLAGVSAGSICWFRAGVSDSRRMTNPDADLIRIRCLGLIDAMHTPHYHSEKDRRPEFKKAMKKDRGIGVVLDDCCAMEVAGETYRIIASKPNARAYKVYWKADKYHEEIIPEGKVFRLLKELLKK